MTLERWWLLGLTNCVQLFAVREDGSILVYFGWGGLALTFACVVVSLCQDIRK